MPIVEYERFKPYPQFVGVFVGGCVERGDGSSFRAKAHAHTEGTYTGWICLRSPKRLYNPKGEPNITMWHELAHLVSGEGHTEKFRRTMRQLCGRIDKDTAARHRRFKEYNRNRVVWIDCDFCGERGVYAQNLNGKRRCRKCLRAAVFYGR